MDEKLDDLALAVKDGFDSVDEQFQGVAEEFKVVNKRLDGLEKTVGNLEKTVANLPDKAYLSDKLADIEGPMVSRTRKQEERFNLLVEFLKSGRALSQDQAQRLAQFEIFPHFPAV